MNNRKLNSCGALLYSYNDKGDFGFIFGKEKICNGGQLKWYPFKGCSKQGETLEETAKREVFEETGGLVTIENIDLHLAFITPKKKYYIGLHYAPYSIVEKFNSMNRDIMDDDFKEKEEMKFIPFNMIKYDKDISVMTKRMLKYFENKIREIPKKRILPPFSKTIIKAPMAPWYCVK